MSELEHAALVAVRDCLGLQPNEKLLIVTDPPQARLARILAEAARPLACEVLVLEYGVRELNGQEPPDPVPGAMAGVDAVARRDDPLDHAHGGAPGGDRRRRPRGDDAGDHRGLPGPDDERRLPRDRRPHRAARRTVDRGERRARNLGRGNRHHAADRRDQGDPVDRVDPQGRSVGQPAVGRGLHDARGGQGRRRDRRRRVARRDRQADRAGAHHRRRRAGGRGRGREQARRFAEQLDKAGPGARNCAELGVGTNDRAVVTGAILEDEKILGTVHIAFGNNASMGGTVSVAFHVDGILLRPTLTLDGDAVLREGTPLFD